MTTNTELWDQLKTVPKDAQKPFKRAGGFSGTAIKPMWTYHKMTEVFGPCGTGWGIETPTFKVIHAADEILVYCTVTVWYGPEKKPLVGVGGDKVLSKNKYGPATDDEAFKKAFTDAITNALKTLGAGADIHMGVYDGKYQDRHEPEPVATPAPKPEPAALGPSAQSFLDDLHLCETGNELSAWAARIKTALGKKIISDGEREALMPAYLARKRAIESSHRDVRDMNVLAAG